jgi:hypothetical protein
MSSEMIVATANDLANLPSCPANANDKTLAQVTSSGEYLPYLQILGSNNESVQRGEQPVGTWGLTQSKQIQNLGKAITVLVLAWRAKAMSYDPVAAYFDPEDPKFKEIAAKSESPNSGCGYGVEFLLYLTDHGKFATYFCGTKTARREAPNIIAVIQKPSRQCQIKAELIESKRNGYKWHGPQTKSFDSPVANMPSMEDLQKWVTKFTNPPKEEKEEATQPASTRG